MSDIFFALQDELSPVLRTGDLKECERVVGERLAGLPASPFHLILDLEVSNRPEEVADYFDDFFRQQPRGKIKAAYTEMNGFDINPNLWFCSPFAYQSYGGHDNYDWLSDWQSDDYDLLPITGLEPLQSVYDSDAFRDQKYEDACSVASLLVVIRFQDLIRRSADQMQELRFPLLATAHDYDFIFEVRKNA